MKRNLPGQWLQLHQVGKRLFDTLRLLTSFASSARQTVSIRYSEKQKELLRYDIKNY